MNGFAATARRSRAAAFARSGARCAPLPKRAKAACQSPQRDRVGRDRAAVRRAVRPRRAGCPSWRKAPRSPRAWPDGRGGYSPPGPAPSRRRRRRSPNACPSSCCGSRPAPARRRASARVARASLGHCTPHSRQAGFCPALASMAVAVSTWAGSPECDAQASAISASVSPNRSAAPLSISGSACIALTAERG